MKYSIKSEYNGKFNIIREQDITCHGLSLSDATMILEIHLDNRPMDEFEGRYFFFDLGNSNYRRVDSKGNNITEGRQDPDYYLLPFDLEHRIWIENINKKWDL